MLLSREDLKENFKKASSRIDSIFAAAHKAPPKYSEHTRHIRNRSLLYAYSYYAGVVKKWAPNAQIVVDWGGQYGHVSVLLSEALAVPVECYLVDCGEVEKYWHNTLSVSNVRTPRPGNPVSKIDHSDKSIDVIVSSGVLEHTYEYGVSDLEALRDIYRVLKDDGKLFIWHLPCRFGFPELINKVLGRWYHHLRYDHDELFCLMGLSGFKIDVIDKHEVLHPVLRNAVMKLFGETLGFELEYKLSKLPLVRIFAQHFTIIAHKVPGFEFSAAVAGTVTDEAGFGRSTVR